MQRYEQRDGRRARDRRRRVVSVDRGVLARHRPGRQRGGAAPARPHFSSAWRAPPSSSTRPRTARRRRAHRSSTSSCTVSAGRAARTAPPRGARAGMMALAHAGRPRIAAAAGRAAAARAPQAEGRPAGRAEAIAVTVATGRRRGRSSARCPSVGTLAAERSRPRSRARSRARSSTIEADLGDRVREGPGAGARRGATRWRRSCARRRRASRRPPPTRRAPQPLRQQGIISLQEYEQVRTRSRSRSARRDQLRIQLEHTHHPRAASTARWPRAWSTPATTCAPARPSSALVQDDPLKFRTQVPERFAGYLQLGQPIRVSVDAVPGPRLRGQDHPHQPDVGNPQPLDHDRGARAEPRSACASRLLRQGRPRLRSRQATRSWCPRRRSRPSPA